METVKKGEGLVEDLHAYLKAENVVILARCSKMELLKADLNLRDVCGGSQSMSAPSRGQVSLRLVQPPPWLIYRRVRSYIPDKGCELYILNLKKLKSFRDLR